MSTQTSEWYTRPKYIEAARTVMDSIDLDPASSAAANEIVKATRYYSKEEDGLLQPWFGNVWLNPPYGRSAKQQGKHQSTIGLFIKKLIESYDAGDITQAIALVTTEINAKWYYPLFRFPVCVPDHRVNFLVPIQQKNKYSQMFGTSFVYLGSNVEKFIDVFSEFGIIIPKTVRRWEKSQPVALPLWEKIG